MNEQQRPFILCTAAIYSYGASPWSKQGWRRGQPRCRARIASRELCNAYSTLRQADLRILLMMLRVMTTAAGLGHVRSKEEIPQLHC